MGRLLAVLWLVALGCGDSTTLPDRDAALPPGVDGGGPVDPFADDDDDGLCNGTEMERGTDPTLPDTDGDGFVDSAEVILGFDPMIPADPDRADVYILRETTEATLQVPIERAVTGGGEDYAGAFEATAVPDLGGDTAESFYVGSVATFGEPMENVAVIDEEAQSFRGVVGRTLMGFEVRFAFGANTPRLCIRGFPFRYNIKRSDGRTVGVERLLLLTLPPGDTLETGVWCNPPGGCI